MSKRKANPRAALPPLDVQQRYDLVEAADYLRISRAKIYADIAAGTLRTIKDGARVFIPGTEIARRSAVQPA